MNFPRYLTNPCWGEHWPRMMGRPEKEGQGSKKRAVQPPGGSPLTASGILLTAARQRATLSPGGITTCGGPGFSD